MKYFALKFTRDDRVSGNLLGTDVNDYCIAIFVRKKEMVEKVSIICWLMFWICFKRLTKANIGVQILKTCGRDKWTVQKHDCPL